MHILSRRTIVALTLRNLNDKGKALAKAFGDGVLPLTGSAAAFVALLILLALH
jgi:hypothetical protein